MYNWLRLTIGGACFGKRKADIGLRQVNQFKFMGRFYYRVVVVNKSFIASFARINILTRRARVRDRPMRFGVRSYVWERATYEPPAPIGFESLSMEIFQRRCSVYPGQTRSRPPIPLSINSSVNRTGWPCGHGHCFYENLQRQPLYSRDFLFIRIWLFNADMLDRALYLGQCIFGAANRVWPAERQRKIFEAFFWGTFVWNKKRIGAHYINLARRSIGFLFDKAMIFSRNLGKLWQLHFFNYKRAFFKNHRKIIENEWVSWESWVFTKN